MRSRYWFLLSVALFIAAAFFWNVGEKIRVSQPAAAPKVSPAVEKKAPAPSPIPAPAVSSNPSKKLLAGPDTNSVTENATNETALFPHRLKNTSQPMEQLVRNDRAVLLRNALIDTGAEGVQIPDELRSKGDPGSYIVQARGTIDATFRAALIEAKAEIISYVPNNAYLVRLPGGAGKLARDKSVQSVLGYEPYYKLDTELLAAVMDKKPLEPEKKVRVGLFPGQLESAVAALKGKARILGEDLKSSPFGPMLIVASADLVQLANMPQVQEIEPFYEREIMNDLTRVRIGVSSNTVTDFNFLDLTGSNIWVNVNDSTIDNSHPDLSPRIFPAAGVGITDPVGHGTHVAGIIASSGVNGPGDSVTNVGSVAGAKFRGQAPSASILSQDIFAGLSDAELQVTAGETNYIQLGRQSPLISNNSWGYGTRTYDSAAASFDAAVRDALPGSIGSQPIAYVFAAGNSGSGPGTVTSPGTAKNVISVGALENKRNITNDIIRPNANCVIVTNKEFLGSTDSSNQVAAFSSRGNVGIGVEGQFGRLKPDVVAPGTFVASTRSQQFDEASYYSPLHVDRRSSPGLVMEPLDTNQFRILIPDNACNEGTTLSLDIDAIIRSDVPPNSSLLIYAGTAPNPSTTPANLVGANSVTIQRANLPLDDFLYYDIVNTNGVEVIYDLQTTLVLSNDFGNFFQVLSNLNGYLAPNYMFESGTSMSAPAISGMLALMQEFFEQRFQITNSPAMMKALLINGSRAVGSGYNKEATLNNAGWGLPDIRRILPTNSDAATWPVQLFDQNTNFSLATGERHDRKVTMNDTNSPLRITLVWTDPPGNPAVGVKLVNDLDLVVTAVVTNGLDTNNQPIVTTNIFIGNNFPGGEFTQANPLGTNGVSEFDAIRDTINNVENVYINGPLSAEYTVSVIAKRVNVNAVTAHTNNIVQDYALVISAGTGTNAPFIIDTNTIFGVTNTNAFVTIVTNTFNNPSEAVGGLLLNQRVGANSPLINVNSNNLTDGTTNQWAFYVLENPAGFTHIAFLTFLPPNLSGAANTVPGSRRVVEADIDMYVSTDPTLTNLNPAAIAGAVKSRERGGEEVVVFTNRNDPVFYVGIKSEDQRASEFSFFAIASAAPFFNEENGIAVVRGLNVGANGVIPDGSPELPQGTTVLFIGPPKMNIGHVIVTNTMTHERLGDLIATLFNNQNSVVLHNHSFPITPEFPDGQESGTYTGIYDDFGLDEGDTVIGGRQTDGPGSLWNFVGADASPAWRMEVEDNALHATGRVEQVTLVLERAPETNDLSGRNGFSISGMVPAGRSVVIPFIVPDNTTNMIISIAPKQGPLDVAVRRLFVPTRAGIGGPYVDKGTNIAQPGASFSLGTNDVPPLQAGRYVLRLFNDGGVNVDFTGSVEFQFNLTAASVQTFSGTGSGNLLDDAVTESIIHVDRDATVVSTEVSVRIDHPRVSDLVLHLVSPEGTRILLAENRGGFSTNGYGFSDLATNVFPSTSSGDANASTNILGPTLPSGIVNVDYEFFGVPDQLRIYYDGVLIFDSGLVNGSGRFSVPYGPGVDTNVVIIMNEGDNPDPSTAWNYTATVLSGNLVYATFSENTNLALVPIKFAIPPFATNIPALNTNFFMSSFFESDPAGTYNATVDGWTVSSNSVDVVTDALRAHRGTNYLNLGNGTILRTLPTVAGGFYNLKFAYRREQPAFVSMANVTLDGVFTNQFIGNPGWIVHSTSFVAPQNGAQLRFEGFGSGSTNTTNLLANGSFESGLAGWTFNNAGVQISPYTPGTLPTTDGIRAIHIGINDISGSVISQAFPVVPGSNYTLTFDEATLGDAGRTGILRVQLESSLGVLVAQSYTNGAINTLPFPYRSRSVSFTAPAGITTMTVRFLDLSPGNGVAVDPILDNVKVIGDISPSGMWLDTFTLTEGGDPNYFLPEESLKTLIGENAEGDWKLEIWDNRAGAPFGPANLLSWQLHLTFASTNATATVVTNATQVTNTVAGAEIKYFIVDVPIFATRATNVLVSGGGGLNLLFNQDQLPIGNQSLGDFTLLSSTVNGTAVLTTSTFPDLRPGGRYYLGVQNADPAQTNFFTLTVTFDNTNNLVSVTPLTNATPYAAVLPLNTDIHYYQYDLSNAVGSIEFRLFNLTADADLIIRRDQLPTESVFDFMSNAGSTNQEVVTVNSPALGRYYLGVYGFFPTNDISYTIMVTENGAPLAPTLSGQATLSPSGFHVTANTIIGRQYAFDVSLDLVTWTPISTKTATANVTTFTDPTPPSTQTARYYRLRMLP